MSHTPIPTDTDLLIDPETHTPDTDPPPHGWLAVTSMDMQAQGIARKSDGKIVFIEGA